jgi:hypothetical protein
MTGSISRDNQHQDRKWTESVVMGSEGFVTAMKEGLASKVKAREIIG